ncbi:hypothetical protein Tco_0226128, partial [Tanacetum coccineum]
MATNEETNAAGTDTRPPMLVEDDYDSWKIRIQRYIRGKPNGKLIWKSIQNGPTPHPSPQILHLLVSLLCRQGLPRHIFNILNQTSTAQEIWKMFRTTMQGSGRTLQQGRKDFQRKAPGNVGLQAVVARCDMLQLQRRRTCARQCNEPRERWTLSNSKKKLLLMEAKEKGDVLDVEAEAFLADVECTAPYDQPQALTTTNMFQANHEDAYDSDVDEGPNAAVAFMAIYHPLCNNNQVNEKDLSGDQVYWLSANEIASQASKPATPATPFVHKKKDICSIVLTSDIVVPPSSNCLCEDLRSACDREHTKVLELEAEISKQKHLITESEKRILQLKDDTIRNLETQINITRMLNVGSTEGSCDQQALDTNRIQLQDMITSLRVQLDGLKVENVSLKRQYDELSQANTHSRTAYTEKLSALTAKNTKLKAQVT